MNKISNWTKLKRMIMMISVTGMILFVVLGNKELFPIYFGIGMMTWIIDDFMRWNVK